MKETNHDYQNCLVDNYFSNNCAKEFKSWEDFKELYCGFIGNKYDDTYHFVFRYDIDKQNDDNYCLELCIMLQRKGIYTHIYINNIPQNVLDTEVKKWLEGRYDYIKNLWSEVSIKSVVENENKCKVCSCRYLCSEQYEYDCKENSYKYFDLSE